MLLPLLIAAFAQPLTETKTHTTPIVAPRVDIVGEGFNGTDPTGPILVFAGCDGFDLGKGDPFRATGGRLERLRIVTNGTGGTALKFFAASKAERPGEIILRDLKILGLSDLNGRGKNNWERGLVIDGGELNEVNASGVRSISVEWLRVAGCLSDSIALRNVTHFHGRDIQINQGTAPEEKVPTFVIESSRHIFLSQMNLFGELHLRDCHNVIFDGYAQSISVDAKCRGIVLRGIVDRLTVEKGAVGRAEVLSKKIDSPSRTFSIR
ncbi:MAG TPA: hypothetical protein VFG20_08955 [Planctomycetaceae bacterium]|jgi:hypothetical protein|nr:hypothetical protein [Planctomycetaceae bacterium]